MGAEGKWRGARRRAFSYVIFFDILMQVITETVAM